MDCKMALPIRETPFLLGKDAKKFIKKMKEAEFNPVSKKDYERASKIYKKCKKKWGKDL